MTKAAGGRCSAATKPKQSGLRSSAAPTAAPSWSSALVRQWTLQNYAVQDGFVWVAALHLPPTIVTGSFRLPTRPKCMAAWVPSQPRQQRQRCRHWAAVQHSLPCRTWALRAPASRSSASTGAVEADILEDVVEGASQPPQLPYSFPSAALVLDKGLGFRVRCSKVRCSKGPVFFPDPRLAQSGPSRSATQRTPSRTTGHGQAAQEGAWAVAM